MESIIYKDAFVLYSKNSVSSRPRNFPLYLPSHLLTHLITHLLAHLLTYLLIYLSSPVHSTLDICIRRYRPLYNIKGLSPEEQMEVALKKELSNDRPDISSKPVYKKLDDDSSEPRYEAMWKFWAPCVAFVPSREYDESG